MQTSLNSRRHKFEVCVLYLKKALVFLCMLTVLLIDAISEFKANVFHPVSHGACAIYLKEWGPYVSFNCLSPMVFLLIWHVCSADLHCALNLSSQSVCNYHIYIYLPYIYIYIHEINFPKETKKKNHNKDS